MHIKCFVSMATDNSRNSMHERNSTAIEKQLTSFFFFLCLLHYNTRDSNPHSLHEERQRYHSKPRGSAVKTTTTTTNRLASRKSKYKWELGVCKKGMHSALTFLFRQLCRPYANHATKEKIIYIRKKNLHSTWLIKQLKAELVLIKSEEITTLNYKNKLTLFYFITSGEPINLWILYITHRT